MKSKSCRSCKKRKKIAAFYRHAKMRDGFLNKCKECKKADTKRHYRATFSERQKYERARLQRPERRAAKYRYEQRHRQRYPERERARRFVAKAIMTGKLKRKHCELCGAKHDVQAHHADYSKPLEVRWLCRTCHNKEHGKLIV